MKKWVCAGLVILALAIALTACSGSTGEIAPGVVTPITSAPVSTPVVRAVFFWSKSCPSSLIASNIVLPPLQQKYGSQLDLRLIEADTAEELARLNSIARALGVTPQSTGVPLLVIGDRGLVSLPQIRAELPVLIANHLAAGGVELPELPELQDWDD